QEGGGQGTHAGVGDAGCLKHALNISVFTDVSVEGEEGHVEFKGSGSFGKKAAFFSLHKAAIPLGEIEINPRQACLCQIIWYIIGAISQSIADKPCPIGRNIKRKSIVSIDVQSIQGLQSRHNRNVVLWRAAAEQNCNA